MVYLEQDSQFEVCSTVSSDINGSLAGILDFSEDTVSETGNDSGGISSPDGSKSDTAAIIISGTLDISNFFVLQSKSVDL